MPFSGSLWVLHLYLPVFGKNFWIKFLMFMRSFNSFGSWNNDFSRIISEIMPSWNGKFSSKSKLISGLIFSTLYELSKLSWLLGISDLLGVGGGLYVRPRWKGTSGIKGLVCVIPVSALFIVCIGSLEYNRFVFPVSILVLSGSFCDSSDGGLIAWLMGSDLFYFKPALPWPMCGFTTLPFMGLECCFSCFMTGSKFFLMPWTSGSLIPLDLAGVLFALNNYIFFNNFLVIHCVYWKV